MSARHRRRNAAFKLTTFGAIDVEGIAKAMIKFRGENPEEYAAIVARNQIAWAACNYEHSSLVKFCNKCGWHE